MYTFEKNPLLYLPETNLFKIYRNGVLSDLPDAFVTRAYNMIGTGRQAHLDVRTSNNFCTDKTPNFGGKKSVGNTTLKHHDAHDIGHG